MTRNINPGPAISSLMDHPTLWLVVNTASGSNSAEATAAVAEALGRAGARPARTVDVQAGGCPDQAELEAEGVDILAVFAGDGTVNAVLSGLDEWRGAVLVLPGGTMNLLSKALHGDRPAEEIAAQLGAMRIERRGCVTASCGTATIELLAGPGATWSDVREELREGAIGELTDRTVEAVKQSTAGPMVRLVDPALGREDGYPGVRFEPLGETMSADGYGAQGFVDYVRQGIALLRRNFREGPHDELGLHTRVTCESIDGSPIELMIDGERATGLPRETFSLAPLPVNLLASRNG